MSRRRSLLVAGIGVVLGAVLALTVGGPGARGVDGGEAPPDSWSPPKDVRTMLGQVDASSLERFDKKLVGFGTRHTLSSQTDPKRGIGAARDYIRDQFERAAKTSHGRMSVELQSYVQQPADRIPEPTTITNVIATLQGSDPKSADRVYVVSGHYDSRVTNVLNATSDAPGANDDGSGTSAVLELARVMASQPTEATIVFAAFAGEEQGLYGSDHFAQVAKDKGWNIQGVLNMDIVGSPNGGNGVSEPNAIRLFSEGVPTAETAAQTMRRQAIGGENDGVSRQLARFVKETGENDATAMKVKLIWRRSLPAQRRPGVVPPARLAGGAVHRAERELRPRAPGRAGRGRQAVRRPPAGRRLPLPRARHPRGRLLAGRARARAARAGGRPHHHRRARLRHAAALDRQPEPDVVGYEIVWRDSIEPLWTHARDVGNVTDATIAGLNKDDVQVAVRAIDRDGNRSPAAYPVTALQ